VFPHGGHGARLMDPGPGSWAAVPAGGNVFHDVGPPAPQTAHSVLIVGPAGDLGEQRRGPNHSCTRSPPGPRMRGNSPICDAGKSGSWNIRPPVGMTSRQMGTAPTRRAPGPARRCHGRRSTPTRPAVRRPAGGPRPAEHDQTRRDPVERERADRTVLNLTRSADPCTHRDRAGEGPRPGERGGRRGRPATEPRTVATERAQYGHPTVPAFDLGRCLKPPWSQRRAPDEGPRFDAGGNRDRRGST